jgi:hypothetical protein
MYTFSPTAGERFYNLIDRESWMEHKKEEVIEAQVPSVTTLLSVWPKGQEFDRWMASKESYGEAMADRNAGGRRGTRVHEHLERIVKGEVLSYHEFKKEYHKGDDLTAYDEWRRIESFVSWHRDHGYPTIVSRRSGKPAIETTLYSWEHGYAGTTDLVVTGGQFGSARVLVDFKTGKGIYDSFWAQLAAYRRAWKEMGEGDIDAIGILLFGGLGRKHYAFEMCSSESELDAWFADFLAAQRIWNRTHQKTGISKGERIWKEVKSERDVYEVEDILRLDVPVLVKAVQDDDETPAWAKRPEPVKEAPTPTKRPKILIP